MTLYNIYIIGINIFNEITKETLVGLVGGTYLFYSNNNNEINNIATKYIMLTINLVRNTTSATK